MKRIAALDHENTMRTFSGNLILPLALAMALLAWASAAPIAHAAPPTISNVRAAQRADTKLVDITYDVADPDSETVTIHVAVSQDAGATYSMPATTFTGDYGQGVKLGTGKRIVWNAGLDWGGHLTTQGRVRITAEDAQPAAAPPGNVPPNMVLIPAGAFQIGDNFEVSSRALPVRTVTLSAFYIDKYEITFQLWDQVYQWAILHGYTFGDLGKGDGPNHPVHSVDWFDAVKWCNARSEMQGRTPAYYTEAAQTNVFRKAPTPLDNSMVKWSANGFRLPTEAEWEKAARGGLVGNHFPWPSFDGTTQFGKLIDGSKANYAGSKDPFEVNLDTGQSRPVQTTPVGYYNGQQILAGVDMANGYGLYDMAGNVDEWCWDLYSSLGSAAAADPRGPNSGAAASDRVLRGGSWFNSADSLRCSGRYNYFAFGRSSNVGFRSALGQP